MTEAATFLSAGVHMAYALSTANKMPMLFKIFYNLARRMKVQGATSNPAQSLKLFQVNNMKERF